jgi:hypothetical protein
MNARNRGGVGVATPCALAVVVGCAFGGPVAEQTEEVASVDAGGQMPIF